eukprot:m.128012 g.128012  ORF g.128012 m.128012 type:complete len:226 (-) comp9741_c0_seq2:336-1013(-)
MRVRRVVAGVAAVFVLAWALLLISAHNGADSSNGGHPQQPAQPAAAWPWGDRGSSSDDHQHQHQHMHTHMQVPTDIAMYTASYVAPEILRSEEHRKRTGRSLAYGTACDVWSLGVVLYVMLAGYQPFYSRRSGASNVMRPDMKRQILVGLFDFPAREWAAVSDAAKDVVGGLLTVAVDRRLSLAALLAHPWIATHAAADGCSADDVPMHPEDAAAALNDSGIALA